MLVGICDKIIEISWRILAKIWFEPFFRFSDSVYVEKSFGKLYELIDEGLIYVVAATR